MDDLFKMPSYALPAFSAADEAGIADSITINSLTDNDKNWTPGVWQGAMLLISINNQVVTIFVSTNSANRLVFSPTPMLQGQTPSVPYILKRTPPSITRPGIALTGNQVLRVFSYIAGGWPLAPFPNPVPYVKPSLPAPSTVTGPLSPTTMIDGAANFYPNSLVGGLIFNDSDVNPATGVGSYGVILSNTATAIVVAQLNGGLANVFAPGDNYSIGVHYIDTVTGIQTPFTVPAGSTLSFLEQYFSYNQPCEAWMFIDGLILTPPGFFNPGFGYFAQISKYSTMAIDPSAALPHTVDVILINRGTAALRGGSDVVTILETL